MTRMMATTKAKKKTSYGDPVEKRGWVGSSHPDSQTKRLRYYSEFFQTAELDATFYDKFYLKMTSGTFYGNIFRMSIVRVIISEKCITSIYMVQYRTCTVPI